MTPLPGMIGRAIAGILLFGLTAFEGRSQGLVVPQQDTDCDLPGSLEGVSGHALFRVTVNRAGRLDWISPLYVSTDPGSSSKDFVEALTACMKGWRYRNSGPADRVPAMRLLVPFHYFSSPAGTDGGPGGDVSVAGARFKEISEEKLSFASMLMAGKRFAEIQGKGWLMRSDVRQRDRDAAVESIRFAVEAFENIITDSSPPDPTPEMTLLLFRKVDHFNQIAAFDNVTRMARAPAGKYHPLERVAYASAGGTSWAETLQAIGHEVSHHLVHTRLFPGRHPPPWVNEGIATYIGLLSRPDDGPIDPGRFQRGAYVTRYLDALDRHLPGESSVRLQRLLAGSWNGTTLDYALSWLVVHYLINAEGDERREAFRSWLTGEGTFTFGESIPELRKALYLHRKGLEVR